METILSMLAAALTGGIASPWAAHTVLRSGVTSFFAMIVAWHLLGLVTLCAYSLWQRSRFYEG